MAKKVDKETLYENFSQEIRRGVLVLAVLSQLSEAQYGYSLKQRLSEKGLDINEGTLYPLLRRLEAQGLLESSWEVIDDARPRRYYKISEQGDLIRINLVQEWESTIDVMTHLLVKDIR
jgi:DNA-binding PadR family transcriptional regulator